MEELKTGYQKDLTEKWKQNMRNTEKCLKGMWTTVKYIYIIQFSGEGKVKHYLRTESIFEEILVKKFPKPMEDELRQNQELCLLSKVNIIRCKPIIVK